MRQSLKVFVCSVLAAFTVACGSDPTPAPTPSPSPTASPKPKTDVSGVDAEEERERVKIEQKLLNLINNRRRDAGLRTVSFHRFLRDEARKHAEFLAESGYPTAAKDSIAHEGVVDRFGRAEEADPGIQSMCENVGSTVLVADGRDATRRIFRGWDDSPSHHNCLFDIHASGWTAESGAVGVVNRGSQWWAVFLAADDLSRDDP